MFRDRRRIDPLKLNLNRHISTKRTWEWILGSTGLANWNKLTGSGWRIDKWQKPMFLLSTSSKVDEEDRKGSEGGLLRPGDQIKAMEMRSVSRPA